MTPGFRALAEGLNHPEGVTWNPLDGKVYAGGEDGEIYAVTLEGEVTEVARTGGSMLGVAVDGRGRVYACDDGKGNVVRWDRGTGVEVYARGPGGEEMDTPNMLAFGPDGALYVTCSGEEEDPTILRVAPGGRSERWTDAVPAYPNGCAVTPAGDALIVVEAHAQRIVRVPIGAEGAAGTPEIVAELPGTDPDGVTLVADGSCLVTLYRPDGIVGIAWDGAVTTVVEDPLARTFDAPTNLVFADVGLDLAVVANVGDRFLSVGELGVVGAPMHFPEVP